MPTGRLFADFTVKMQVPIVMGLLIASVVAKDIFGRRIFLNTVYDAFSFKRFDVL